MDVNFTDFGNKGQNTLAQLLQIPWTKSNGYRIVCCYSCGKISSLATTITFTSAVKCCMTLLDLALPSIFFLIILTILAIAR